MGDTVRGVVPVGRPTVVRRVPTRNDDPIIIVRWTADRRNALRVSGSERYFLGMLEGAIENQAETRRKLGVALDVLRSAPLADEYDERLATVLQLADDLRL